MDDSRNFLSLTGFQNKYNLKVRPLAFYGLISAVKLLKGHISQNTRVLLKYESFLCKFVVNSKPSRLVYKKLVSKKSESPSSSQQKWLEDINIMINWKTVYQLSSQCTKSTKLIAFNFKFLHRRLSTNKFLKKISVGQNLKTSFHASFQENSNLCVVKCLKEYELRTLGFRPLVPSQPNKLLLPYIRPQKPISSASLSRWLKDLISQAGIDTSIFKAHSVRGASSSATYEMGVSLQDILDLAIGKLTLLFGVFITSLDTMLLLQRHYLVDAIHQAPEHDLLHFRYGLLLTFCSLLSFQLLLLQDVPGSLRC